MNPRARRDRDYGEEGYIQRDMYRYSRKDLEPVKEAMGLKHLAEERARCKEVEAGWIAEAVKAKALCHPECGDGYCHRAYTNAPMLRKDV